MYPHSHFLATFFLAEIFVRLGYISHRLALICAVIAVLIDLDHFIEYIIIYRRASLRQAWNACVTNKLYGRTAIHRVFGVVMFALVTLIISIFSLQWAIVIGLGYYSHLFMDLLYNLWEKRTERTIKIKMFGYIIHTRRLEILIDLGLLVGLYLIVYM
ncbi:metal-dependent hydrolase [Candidatus Woesearchaeota archaeon]|nr:metal-dependent hydrolase [Candidatus Woesearchaeota archaeon]MBW3018369.1 metal-dependent hydrolase [Candidatus Woesearchaeota archaeon]